MIYGYARVSTDGQSVDAQVEALKAAGCDKVIREVASGARDRPRLKRLIRQLEADDVLQVTRIDRLARSSLDLHTMLNAIAERGAGFRSLGDAWQIPPARMVGFSWQSWRAWLNMSGI